jgi:Uma2 family endonuclease
MPLLVLDPEDQKAMIRRRRRLGIDKFDEVWNGVYVMSPLADDLHQNITGELDSILREIIQRRGLGFVRPGVNITDRPDAWEKNYRCPDVVAFLNGTTAVNYGTFWHGGPDFAVEIRSRGDVSRKKLPFYARVGTRELLIIDRHPWALELYRLDGEAMRSVGKVGAGEGELASDVVPLRFALRPGEARPRLVVTHQDGQPVWEV